VGVAALSPHVGRDNAYTAIGQLVTLATLYSTARRRNGYAGHHDLATGVRVVVRRVAAAREPPAQSAWATHRESMSAALALPNTGQAIAIDLGEANDIHPRNKLDVGARLARIALGLVYRNQLVASGPTYRAHTIRDGRVSIEFDHAGGGLVTRRTDGTVGGFAIAGADGRLVWADARIDGNKVVVWSDKVPNPVTVRYAWSNNPSTASLYNREGLPTAPFRTDK
jgi:sialate O-acetylesterase